MLVPILVSLLFTYSLCKEFQINAPGENIKGFWPGDQQINPGERCAIAVTNTKVFRIVGGRASGQTIPGMVAAAGIYNQATTAMWLGVAYANGTIVWYESMNNCQTQFTTQWDYPVMDYPGVKWNMGVTRVDDDSLESYATFIGDKSLVEIVYNPENGQPTESTQFHYPNYFPNTNFTVVGYGDALPFPGSQTPSIAIARQYGSYSNGTGELVLINRDTDSNPISKYFPNIRGWQSKSSSNKVTAFGLINPVDASNFGYLIGFNPSQTQPNSIPFPLDNGQKWSAGVSWKTISKVEKIGIFAVGKGQPGGDINLRFVSINYNGTFQLLAKNQTIPNTSNTWIPDTPSFLSTGIVGQFDSNTIWFTAQRAAGPVIFQVPLMALSRDEIFVPLPTRDEIYKNSTKRYMLPVLCDKKKLCETLSPNNDCGRMCCQTNLDTDASPPKYYSVCCKDCNLGNCVGSPGHCVS